MKTRTSVLALLLVAGVLPTAQAFSLEHLTQQLDHVDRPHA